MKYGIQKQTQTYMVFIKVAKAIQQKRSTFSRTRSGTSGYPYRKEKESHTLT